jgi:hypothetical protein
MTIKGSESINELATALSKAQGEFLPAQMDAVNPFLKNKYADLGSVIKATKVACAKYGLAVVQPASTEDGNVTVTTMLMHTSGQWLESAMTLPLNLENKNIAQSAGSIITYLRRYSLSAMLGIYADEDTDGEKQAQQKVPVYTTKQAVEDLGFEEPPAPPRETLRDKIYVQDEPPAEKELPPPAINLEIALAVIGKSDNRKYGECTAEELNNKKLGLRKLLGSDKPLTDDRREEAYYKLEAIRVIEKAVADHKHVYPQATAE